MHPSISNRIITLPSSATIAMNQRAVALREEGYDIINLSLGEPDFETPTHIQDAAKCAIDSGHYFGYPPIAGYADLRAAIAEKLVRENGIACTAEQVVVSNGAKQSIANVFYALLNPGDEVIVYTPYWVSYVAMIALAGGKPVLLCGDAEDDFHISSTQLSQAITPRTKAIIFSNPCNPTGHVMSEQVLEGIAQVLREHTQVMVISDEIYEYIHFGERHHSMGALEGMQGRVATINGFSKGFAMTGWRVGYMAGPLWLAQACAKVQGQTTSAPSSIAQRAALAALQGDKSAISTMVGSYRARRDLCLSLLADIPDITCQNPLGAFYLFPDVSAYLGRVSESGVINSTEDLCIYILEKVHVSLVPGSAFGAPNHIRISYASSEKQLRIALMRIREALSQLF